MVCICKLYNIFIDVCVWYMCGLLIPLFSKTKYLLTLFYKKRKGKIDFKGQFKLTKKQSTKEAERERERVEQKTKSKF